MNEVININVKDLPIEVMVRGENGERKPYILVPAGRKFGVCLQAPQINQKR